MSFKWAIAASSAVRPTNSWRSMKSGTRQGWRTTRARAMRRAAAPTLDDTRRRSLDRVIDVQDLVKRYRKASRNAVDGISFKVGAGEFFALLGPNGAGKTTTISILTTTLQPTAGRATIDGHDVVRAASEVRRRVGIIFQRPSLDRNLTAEENVR